MSSPENIFRTIAVSLVDLLGQDYLDAVCSARAFLSGEAEADLRAFAARKVDLYPEAFHQRLLELLPRVGETCCSHLGTSSRGATTEAFAASTKTAAAPVNGLGFYRIGEDGRLNFTLKSEHYHTPLGHGFPGYALLEQARRLGIPNATHNNTRGHVTRVLEEELIRTAAGLPIEDPAGIERMADSKKPQDLNRVLNLETGSLAVEAALKLCLSRFYQSQPDAPAPKYAGRVPVFVVLGDDEGGLEANYHGTTLLAQALRGMWPEAAQGLERQGTLLVRGVRPNRVEDLEAVLSEYDAGRYKVAGFFHELVLMNYAAKRLTKEFVRTVYTLCEERDIPTIVDEIQTGIWSPELFLFREYAVRPWAVALGKGFPGGEYPASRLIFTAALDTLPQFGALVTNGQEEIASLAYLVTMCWAEANADATRAVGEYYEERLKDLVVRHPHLIAEIEGCRHLASLYFHELAPAKAFVKHLNDRGFDISVQSYKLGCPPSPLTKLPIIADRTVVDAVVTHMEEALRAV